MHRGSGQRGGGRAPPTVGPKHSRPPRRGDNGRARECFGLTPAVTPHPRGIAAPTGAAPPPRHRRAPPRDTLLPRGIPACTAGPVGAGRTRAANRRAEAFAPTPPRGQWPRMRMLRPHPRRDAPPPHGIPAPTGAAPPPRHPRPPPGPPHPRGIAARRPRVKNYPTATGIFFPLLIKLIILILFLS